MLRIWHLVLGARFKGDVGKPKIRHDRAALALATPLIESMRKARGN